MPGKAVIGVLFYDGALNSNDFQFRTHENIFNCCRLPFRNYDLNKMTTGWYVLSK